jgi:hypothetical protein
MFSRISSLAGSAMSSLVMLALVQAAAIAAPPVPDMDHLTMHNGFVESVFDDGGWRPRSHSCCHGRRGGSSAGLLGRDFTSRLGGREKYLDDRYDGDRDKYEDGSSSRYDDEPVYQHQLLDRPRVYQRDSFGGGFFGQE